MQFEGGPQMVGPCDLRPQREDPVDREPQPRAVAFRRVEQPSWVGVVIASAVGMVMGRISSREVEA